MRRGGQFAVGLVDQHQIGQLDDAALDPLQLVASRRRQDQNEHIDDIGNRGFGLADADRLDQYCIEAGRLAHQAGLARATRDAPSAVARRGRPDKRFGRARQLGHAGLVAEDRAAAPL